MQYSSTQLDKWSFGLLPNYSFVSFNRDWNLFSSSAKCLSHAIAGRRWSLSSRVTWWLSEQALQEVSSLTFALISEMLITFWGWVFFLKDVVILFVFTDYGPQKLDLFLSFCAFVTPAAEMWYLRCLLSACAAWASFLTVVLTLVHVRINKGSLAPPPGESDLPGSGWDVSLEMFKMLPEWF